MRSRADDVRRRIEKRKRQRERMTKNINNRVLWSDDDEMHEFDKIYSYDGRSNEPSHPLFSKEMFMLKILGSACLVLVVAILFKNQSPTLDSARTFVSKSMENEFQFASVSAWYEEQFGKPLALLPLNNGNDSQSPTVDNKQYAQPASGRILEDFTVNGQGVTIETEKGAKVEAMEEGLVSFIGNKDGFGKTIIIQHPNKSESWYGNLADVNVNLYGFVEKGDIVGSASDGQNGDKGEFFFAIKKGDDFIDPIQVIQFE